MEYEHKQCIQHDVAACRRNACFDGRLRKPVRLDQNFQIVGCHVKRNKRCDYSKILLHIVNRLIRCTQKKRDLIKKEQDRCGDCKPDQSNGNHAAGKNFVCTAALAPALAYGSARACSDCKKNSQCECRVDNRHRKIYCRQCILAHAARYEDTVYHRIDGIDPHCGNGRHNIMEEFRFDITFV